VKGPSAIEIIGASTPHSRSAFVRYKVALRTPYCSVPWMSQGMHRRENLTGVSDDCGVFNAVFQAN
jgi:hypothetical protein